MATPAWAENASCAAGLLSREWHEGTGASDRLQPNPRCANSRLLSTKTTRFAIQASRAPTPVLTLGYIYYCNGHHIALHTSAWSAWPVRERQRLFFLIVDDARRPATKRPPPALTCVRGCTLPSRAHRAGYRMEHRRCQESARRGGGGRHWSVYRAPCGGGRKRGTS